jgi:hypothetical protein
MHILILRKLALNTNQSINIYILQLFSKQKDDNSCQQPLGLTYLSKQHLVRHVVSATEGNATNVRLHSPLSWYASGLGRNTFIQVSYI